MARARDEKKPFLHDDNDNSNYTDRWETDTASNGTNTNNNPPRRRRRVTTVLTDTLAVSAVGASVYVLLQWSLMGLSTSSTFSRLVIVLACSCSLTLAALVIHQERKQQRLGALRQVYAATKRTVRSLQQQNERWCRSLTALDRTVDRVAILEQELRQYTRSRDALRCIQVIQEYTQTQRRLKEQLLYQLQEQILCAVLMQFRTNLNSDDDTNIYMTASDLGRLIVQLNNTAGVVLVSEASLRDILALQESNKNEGDSKFTIPLENVLSLLRRLRKDAALDHKSKATLETPSSGGNKEGFWLDDDTTTTTLFQFQPRVLLPSTKDLMEF